MAAFAELRSLTPPQRHTFIASSLAWTFDAFDFFVLVFVLGSIAAEFKTDITAVSFAITLTLATRPIGALLFGLIADHFGRKPALMLCIGCYSVIELLSAFAPSLSVLIALRAIYGVAMGGLWGAATSLTFEAIPTKARGIVSGILQQGYAAGYLVAAAIFALLFERIGWRGMFGIGVLPVLLVPYLWFCVPESNVWRERRGKAGSGNLLSAIRGYWPTFLLMVVLMAAFNFFSHGTQDLYPTFLAKQHNLSDREVGLIAIVYNVGAMIGGVIFGSLSERLGRRRSIVLAALLSLPILPLWAFSSGTAMLALGAFLMQLMVQGAWGVIPVHLNELSPDAVRGTLPGLAYQLGNLIASINAPLQASIAERHGGDYALSLAIVAGVTAIVIALLAAFSSERKDVAFGAETPG